MQSISRKEYKMSIWSDYENGYMDDYEYREECKRMNRQDRYERDHEFDEEEVEEEIEDEIY
jgi:hypothetical protein